MNLLLIFASIARHQKLSMAAEELGLTKSAISHAVQRLRDIFDDELFLRRQSGVQMTTRALTLAPKITSIIGLTSDALLIEENFNPATDRRTLRLGASERANLLFGPTLGSMMQREAPNMRLSIVAIRRAELIKQTANNSVDVGLGSFYGGVGNLTMEDLVQDRYVVVARKKHPLVGKRLTRNQYLQAEHIGVIGSTQEPVMLEPTFAALGISRNVAMTLPLFVAGFAATAKSDRLLTAPGLLARHYAASFGLKIYPLPFPAPQFSISMISHPRTARDPAIAWLHAKLRIIASTFPR